MTRPTGSAGRPSSGFAVEYVATGVHAHGFGRTDDGRPFSFRVRRNTLRVDVYRPAPPSGIPTAADVVARTRVSVAEVDLGDERSVVAAVRDAVALTEPHIGRPRTVLGRILARLPGR